MMIDVKSFADEEGLQTINIQKRLIRRYVPLPGCV